MLGTTVACVLGWDANCAIEVRPDLRMQSGCLDNLLKQEFPKGQECDIYVWIIDQISCEYPCSCGGENNTLAYPPFTYLLTY